jgi:aldose 1-epimerase
LARKGALASLLPHGRVALIYRPFRGNNSAMLQITFHLALLLAALCTLQSVSGAAAHRVEERAFGTTADGRAVKLFTLHNARGMSVSVMEYGATMTEILAEDRNHHFTNVLLGAKTFDEYAKGFGGSASVIGRFANRIANARFNLDGQEYKLAANNGKNHIHGGNKGFASVVWNGKALPVRDGESSVQFTYVSKDGDEG